MCPNCHCPSLPYHVIVMMCMRTYLRVTRSKTIGILFFLFFFNYYFCLKVFKAIDSTSSRHRKISGSLFRACLAFNCVQVRVFHLKVLALSLLQAYDRRGKSLLRIDTKSKSEFPLMVVFPSRRGRHIFFPRFASCCLFLFIIIIFWFI